MIFLYKSYSLRVNLVILFVSSDKANIDDSGGKVDLDNGEVVRRQITLDTHQ